jgi:hypothetical protein
MKKKNLCKHSLTIEEERILEFVNSPEKEQKWIPCFADTGKSSNKNSFMSFLG